MIKVNLAHHHMLLHFSLAWLRERLAQPKEPAAEVERELSVTKLPLLDATPDQGDTRERGDYHPHPPGSQSRIGQAAVADSRFESLLRRLDFSE
jgi:hypothetical protein